jgi:hypothetical protein
MKMWPVIFALSGLAAPAFGATCDIAIQSGPATHVVYDPFSPSPTPAEVVLKARNSAEEPCVGQIFLEPVDGAAVMHSAGVTLRYGDGRSGLSNQFGPYPFQIAGGSDETLRIPLVIDPGQIVPGGSYVADLLVRGAQANGEPLVLGSPNVALRAEVPARALMSISGTRASFLDDRGAPPRIDFGPMAKGASERVFINVWANSSVNITIASENSGELRRDGVDLVRPVRYQASFDGIPISLETAYLTQRSPPLNIAGTSYELAFTLLDSGQFAGVYRDTVYVTLDAN